MPITGTFEADFTQFLEETQKASRGLSGFSIIADDTAKSITGLEKATTTAGPQVATLTQSYHQFDGILRAVGVNISPQISALEELGTAAMSTGAEIGLLGQAGLAIGVAMAAWEVGKWIGHITGMDDALDEWVTHLAGAKTAVESMADAAEAALSHQQEMIFEAAAIAGKSTANLEDAQKALAKFYAQQKKDSEDAEAATRKHIDAIGQVNEALKSHEQILRDVSPAEQAVIKSALEHGVSQGLLAESTGKTALQIRTLAQELASEKKNTEEAAAANRQADAELRTQYTSQITQIDALEKARLNHYGVDAQIEILKQLGGTEEDLTRKVYLQIDSEKDRMKILEANNKRQTELELEIGKLRDQQARDMAESTLRAVGLQAELNKAYGLDAKGAILLPQDAMSEYQKKIDAINGSMKDGAEKTAALALANKQLEDSFLADAKAADTSAVAIQGTTAAVKTAQQVATDRANASLGGGTLGAGGGASSPDISGYMAQGYSLGEALAIALGHGEHIIGQSSGQLAKISGGAFGRAIGGPVTAGGAYVVGERGPELFSPAVNGSISPSLGGGGISIVIQGSVLSTQAELAALVERAMLAAYRRGGNRLPV